MEGLLLNNGWKFQAGDNPDWAKNDYNDNSWSTINPAKDIYDLPENSKKGICWLRLHIYSGNTIDKQFSIFLQQSGASEIYMDGSLIYVFGVISKNTAEIKGFDPLWKPLRLPILKEGNHILAVRYELQPGIFYTNAFETVNPIYMDKSDGSEQCRCLLSKKILAHSVDGIYIHWFSFNDVHTSYDILPCLSQSKR